MKYIVVTSAIRTNLLSGVNNEYNKILANSKDFKKPLTKFKFLMDNEIEKQVKPKSFAIS